MKHTKTYPTALFVLTLLTSVSECNHVEVTSESITLDQCNPKIQLEALRTVKDEEATVEQFTRDSDKLTYYLVKYPSVPTGYLSVCNLPDNYKVNNLNIKFSGTVYKIEEIDFMNRNSIPAEFSSIQKMAQK